MESVLITYGWVRSSYAALRNLSLRSIPVYVSDSRWHGMCQWSRLSQGFDLYTSHYTDEGAFMDDVIDICQKRRISMILPSHNETEVLARHRTSLPRDAGRLLPRVEQVKLFNDKSKSYDFVASLGIPTPKRFAYSEPAQICKESKASHEGRYVVKLRTGNSAKGVFYANGLKETRDVVAKLIGSYDLEPARYPQVEEYVQGEGWGCSVLYWQGRCIASFTHRRLREKIATGGTSTLREAATSLALEQSARRIFDSIGWHGLAMCEFKVCPETGRHWFIEVNPRLWGSIPLAIDAGIEFPYLAWRCAVEGPDTALKDHARAERRLGWQSRWLLGDVTIALSQAASGQFRTAYELLFKTCADSTDDFFLDDPFVFPGEVAAYLSNVIRGRSLNPSEKGMIG